MASGPVPKRSSQRRRENVVPVEIGGSDGQIRGPELTGEHCELAHEVYETIRRSGQAQFFEPSDWGVAKLAVTMIDQYAKRPGAEMGKLIQSYTSQLLMGESDRRRIHLELQRAAEPGSERDAAITVLASRRFATD